MDTRILILALHLSSLSFQKADSDLDYIQYRLEYEIKTNHSDTAGKLSPLTKEEKTAAEQLKSFVSDL
uniref:Ska2 N-terminal domain-containing protein n=1 Tax=Suricata suricatta TaxID=37032 RepID=A0A673U913_SURSU